jgi:hypothetical protein
LPGCRPCRQSEGMIPITGRRKEKAGSDWLVRSHGRRPLPHTSGVPREANTAGIGSPNGKGDGALRPCRAICESVSSVWPHRGRPGEGEQTSLRICQCRPTAWDDIPDSPAGRIELERVEDRPGLGTLEIAVPGHSKRHFRAQTRISPQRLGGLHRQLGRKLRSREGISDASAAHGGLATARATAGGAKSAPAQALANTTRVPVIQNPGRKRHFQKRDTRLRHH